MSALRYRLDTALLRAQASAGQAVALEPALALELARELELLRQVEEFTRTAEHGPRPRGGALSRVRALPHAPDDLGLAMLAGEDLERALAELEDAQDLVTLELPL